MIEMQLLRCMQLSCRYSHVIRLNTNARSIISRHFHFKWKVFSPLSQVFVAPCCRPFHHTRTSKDLANHLHAESVPLHVPVLVDKVVDLINPKDGDIIVDMTFGAGGHTRALLSRCSDITVYALDRDATSYNLAQRLSETHSQVIPLHGRFSNIFDMLHEKSMVGKVDAILFDVGASSMQFDSASRGFSLSRDGQLDMRMDQTVGCLTAEDVVNNMSEDALRVVIKTYGEEKRARDIARAIVDSRYTLGRIRTTSQLANIVASAFNGSNFGRDSLDRPAHVATKTFLALRIFINDELNELYNGLEAAHAVLRPSGLCSVISFHSLEDRIVKRHFHGQDMDERANMSITDRHRNPSVLHSAEDLETLLRKRWKPCWKGLLAPDDQEIAKNPRARSAKLRAAWKL